MIEDDWSICRPWSVTVENGWPLIGRLTAHRELFFIFKNITPGVGVGFFCPTLQYTLTHVLGRLGIDWDLGSSQTGCQKFAGWLMCTTRKLWIASWYLCGAHGLGTEYEINIDSMVFAGYEWRRTAKNNSRRYTDLLNWDWEQRRSTHSCTKLPSNVCVCVRGWYIAKTWEHQQPNNGSGSSAWRRSFRKYTHPTPFTKFPYFL